jgi:hypothetical protein
MSKKVAKTLLAVSLVFLMFSLVKSRCSSMRFDEESELTAFPACIGAELGAVVGGDCSCREAKEKEPSQLATSSAPASNFVHPRAKLGEPRAQLQEQNG